MSRIVLGKCSCSLRASTSTFRWASSAAQAAIRPRPSHYEARPTGGLARQGGQRQSIDYRQRDDRPRYSEGQQQRRPQNYQNRSSGPRTNGPPRDRPGGQPRDRRDVQRTPPRATDSDQRALPEQRPSPVPQFAEQSVGVNINDDVYDFQAESSKSRDQRKVDEKHNRRVFERQRHGIVDPGLRDRLRGPSGQAKAGMTASGHRWKEKDKDKPRAKEALHLGRKKMVRKEWVAKKVTLPTTVRLEQLTNLLNVKLWRLQKTMERVGLEDTRPDRMLTADDASLIAMELNFEPTIDDEAAFDIYPRPPPQDRSALPLRPPVTGIFGHVDHGKTSLLDALRATSVASGEAGGITQHIGAFEVPLSSIRANLSDPSVTSSANTEGTITFLDTPGHAAFSAMRERGAGVTDIVVLVVAADDGVKPQTEEVIRLLKSADVGVVVALTKVDKPGIDLIKVKQQLMSAGVEIEYFGGEVPCVEVSSVTRKGLPDLLETISVLAEMRELRAERDGQVEGRVLESRVEKGRGNVATVLVTRGCLKPTSSIIAGTTWCRVRSLTPPSGSTVSAVYPGQPVEVTGWKDLPSAGDQVLESSSEDEAKRAVSNRLRRLEQAKTWEDLEAINEKRRTDAALEAIRKAAQRQAMQKGASASEASRAVAQMDFANEREAERSGPKELVLVVKADVSGTVEAVVGALEGIGNAEAKVKIVSATVGDIQDSDVEMARAVGGHVVGFNVKAPNAVLKNAARPPDVVQIHASPIIYRLVETIRNETAALLPKHIESRVHGEAVIQQVFEITIKGKKEPKKIAGCKVGNGVFQRARKARVVRKGDVLFTGTVETLKHVKKDVQEIAKGVECGIALDGFDDFRPDDVIQSIEEIEITRKL